MAESRVAYRYALSLFNVAQESKSVDAVVRDLEGIRALMESSREFQLFLRTPVINTMRKKGILNEILRKRVGELTMHFLLLLASKDREGILDEIIAQFFRIRDRELGILDVTVRTASTFTKAQEKSLVTRLESVTRKRVRVKFLPDASLKGGFTIQYDDTVWDASLRHQLESLRQQFIGAS